MDVEAIESLGRRFWYRLGGAVAVAVLAVVVAAWTWAPEDAWLVALLGSLAVVTFGLAVVSLTTGERVDAAGQATAGIGWVVMATGTATEWSVAPVAGAFGVDNPGLWVAIALLFVGGVVSLLADFGDDLRRAMAGQS